MIRKEGMDAWSMHGEAHGTKETERLISADMCRIKVVKNLLETRCVGFRRSAGQTGSYSGDQDEEKS